MSRRILVYLFCALIGFSISIGILNARPQTVSAVTTRAEDEQRQKLAAFRTCLDLVDREDNGGNPAEDFGDLWKDGMDDWNKQHIVVGFQVDSTQGDGGGMQACKTTVRTGLGIMENRTFTEDQAADRLVQLLLGQSGFTPEVSGGALTANLQVLQGRVEQAINALGAPTIPMIAARYAGLISLCYNIKDFSQRDDIGGRDFTWTDRDDKRYSFIFKHVNIPSFVREEGRGVSANRVYLGDLRLDDFDDEGDFDGWDQDFFPFGGDLIYHSSTRGVTAGHQGNAILDCKFVKDQLTKTGSTLPNYVTSVNTSDDTLTFAEDTNGDGLGDQPIQSVNVPGASTASDEDSGAACVESGFDLSWIVCPVVNALANSSDWLYRELIRPLLQTKTIDPSDSSDPTVQAWSSFRILANIILVVALFVIAFGQGLGIDAYTIKKTLPKLLIAAILINLSIYIVYLLVDITNVAGRGLSSLIYAPFRDIGGFKLDLNGGSEFTFFTAIVGGTWWVAAGAPALGFIALFILLPAVLAFVGVVITLLLRRGLILLLIIVSPIAFALYALPNTEKYFKQWWELLWKALLVYPVVVGMFALADVLSVTINQAGETGGLASGVSDILSVIALLAPIFLIPFAFKIAGGAIASLYGALAGWNGKGKEFLKGNPNDPNSLGNKTRRNLAIRQAARGLTAGQIGSHLNPANLTRSGRARAKGRIGAQRQAALENLRRQSEKTPLWEWASNDSNVTKVLALNRNGHEARQSLDAERAKWKADGVADSEIQRRYGQGMAAIGAAEKIGFNPATRRAALLNANTIGFELAGGEEGWNQAINAMASISGGSLDSDGKLVGGDAFQFRSLMDEFQAVAKGPAGRTDLAANVDGNTEYNGHRAWSSVGLYQIGNGKATTVKGSAKYYQGVMERAQDAAKLTNTDIQNFAAMGGASSQEIESYLAGTMSADDTATLKQRTMAGAEKASAVFMNELVTLGSSASGAVRDEALKQRQILEPGVPQHILDRMKDQDVKQATRGFDPTERAARLGLSET